MKKTKVYRPRRGMRFSNGRKGVSPPAGFVGGDPIVRTRPNAFEDSDEFTVRISGDVRTSLQGPPGPYEPFSPAISSSSVSLQGSVSVGRMYERRKLNTALISNPTNAVGGLLPGIPAWPSVRTMEVTDGILGVPTGTFGPAQEGAFSYIDSRTAQFFNSGIDLDFVFRRIVTGSIGSSIIFIPVLTESFFSDASGIEFDYVPGVSTSARLRDLVAASSSFYVSVSGARTSNTGAMANFGAAELDFTLGYTQGSSQLLRRPEPPSWTRAYMGESQAFVIPLLGTGSSAVNSLNCFISGSDVIESSPVTVSRRMTFSKEQRFQTILVKHTASALDTIVQVTGTTPTTFFAGTGTLCSLVTGSGIVGSGGNPAPFCASTNNPAAFFINVPVSGKLVDIRVWLELVHISSSSGQYDPLGLLGVSLRSPNVSWGHAHPIYNDQLFRDQALADHFSASIPNFYRDTYLLWEGPGLSPTSGDQRSISNGAAFPSIFDGAGGFNRQKYPSWNLDRGMRTVFSDSSTTPNPRHLYNRVSPSGNFIGSPNSFFGVNSAYGNDVPWTSDKTVFPGTQSRQEIGSPPPGWLTGPANTNAVNEWPTTGVNYGASTIRPLYPLLETIFVKKVIGTETTFMSSSVYPNPGSSDLWRGFRPGLKGTEISGTWTLLIANNFSVGAFGQIDAMDVYFRQMRLEITYETPSSALAYPIRPSYLARAAVPAKQPILLFSISGSDKSNFGTLSGSGPDYFVSQVYTTSPDSGEIGRTFGILLNSGSLQKIGLDPSKGNFALMYRLSGSLANISGSCPGWLTNNFSGMPAIPESSASLVPIAPAPSIDSIPFSKFLQPRRNLDLPQRLADVASDGNAQIRLRDIAAVFVSSSAT